MNEPKPRIAFIQSCWHKDLVDQIKKGFSGELAELGTPEANIDFFEVGACAHTIDALDRLPPAIAP